MELTALVEKFGVAVGLCIFLVIIFVKLFMKQNNAIMDMLENILKNSGKTLLTKDQTIGLFRAILDKQTTRKLLFAKQKLIVNHIFEREIQIKSALSTEFKRITQEESQFLSSFNTSAGDLGIIITQFLNDKAKWEAYMDKIFKVFFSKSTNDQKIEDMASIMNDTVNGLVTLIESKM